MKDKDAIVFLILCMRLFAAMKRETNRLQAVR